MRTYIVFVAAVLGCGGGGVSVEDLPDAIDDNRCDRLVACQGVQDGKTCDAAVGLDGAEFGTIEAGVKDGTIKYDADKAAQCAESFGNTNCTFPGFHDDDPCDDVFKGTVATGGACVIDLQCANGGNCQFMANCDPDVMCCTGVCQGMGETESPIGGPCSDDLHFCGVNAYCKQPTGSNTGTCTALITNEGGACDEFEACANPMYCNLNFQTGMGTCKKPAASKAACVRADLIPCADLRDHCSPTTMTCERDIAVGGACGTGIQCVGYASCINSVCVADIPAGGACVVDTGADCAVDLDCINGVCAFPPQGMTCKLP